MEEAAEIGKELSHSAHASGMNEWVWKRNMIIVTWNVRSLLWQGTLKVLDVGYIY